MPGSYEELFHSVGKEEFMLLFRSNSSNVKIDKELGKCQSVIWGVTHGHLFAVNELSRNKLERAIGVIYKPATERYSHYFNCKLSQQFDCVIHIDNTTALEPLDDASVININEPETYPMGL